MGRAPCCDKTKVKKGPWSPDEDRKLKEYIEKYGTGGNWIALPHKAGLKRCGKSCRLRWLNYLRPNIKHGDFSEDEDRIICNLFASIGSRWSIIASQLPGRTDNDIKNYWNTKLKKKLMGFPPSQRKAYHQQQKQQQQQQQQQHLFPSGLQSTAPLISSPLGLEGLPAVAPYLLNPTSTAGSSSPLPPAAPILNQFQVKESGSLLMFGGEQSCTSSDGQDIEYELCNGGGVMNMGLDSFLFGGMEETQRMLLGGEASLECNYEIKPMVGANNGCNSFYMNDPSSATMDISSKTPQGRRVMDYYRLYN